MKKVLIMMMCVIMVVCFMPTVAMAEGEASTNVLPEGVTDETFTENKSTVTDGTNYYATLQAAVEDVNKKGTDNAVLYCKPCADVGSLQHAPVTKTLTVYGNGACVSGGSERDFDIGNTDPSYGIDITADMTLTVYNLDGCGAWGAKATEHTVNLVFDGCKNMGKVYITGTTGILNIKITNSAFEGVIKEAVYSNADGKIELDKVGFSNLNKAVNLNHKATGVQTVIITDCSFINCGNNVTAGRDEIPVRVLSSVEDGKSEFTVTGCSFSGTPNGGADILLDYGVGTTSAVISDTAANIIQETDNNVGEIESLAQTDTYSKTVQNGAEVTYVAQVGSRKFTSLQEAINAADGDTVTLLGDVKLSAKITIDENITINGNGHTISAADGFKKDKQGHLMLLQSNVTMKNLTLDSKSKANGINTYGTDKSLQINFENVKMLNSAGNGLTAKGGTITLKNVEISGSAWKQSVDISASNDYSNGANLVVDRYCSFGDQVAVVFDNPGDGAKVGNVTSADPSRLIISSSDETKDWSEKGGTPYTKRVFTFTRISTDNGITLPPTTPTDNVTNSGSTAADNATTSADLSNTTSTSNGTTTATVDKTTADKIVDKAVKNKSTEVVIDATANTTTAADSTTIAQVTIPTETLGAIAEKTEADVTIKTDVAEVKMDNAAAAAVSEQATGETVQIIAEKVAEDTEKVEFELKVVCSDGKVISDFNGGSIAVTVALPKAMAEKKVVCVYIDDNGHMSKVEGQKNADGTYTFVTGHFSTYAILAEEEADAAIAEQTEAIKNIDITLSTKVAKTKAGKKGIKLTWKADTDKQLDGVEVFRSVKSKSGYSKIYTTKKAKNAGYYINTKSLKANTKYYYKIRGFVMVDGQKVYTDWSNKGIRTFK